MPRRVAEMQELDYQFESRSNFPKFSKSGHNPPGKRNFHTEVLRLCGKRRRQKTTGKRFTEGRACLAKVRKNGCRSFDQFDNTTSLPFVPPRIGLEGRP